MKPITNYSAILVSGVISLLAFFSLIARKYKPTKTAAIIIVLYSYLSAITFINGYSIGRKGLVGNFALVMFFDYILVREDIFLFKGMLNALNVLAVLNFVSIILAPAGGFVTHILATHQYTGGHYILGYDNGQIIMLLPTICFNLILYKRKNRIGNFIIAILSTASMFIFFSVTSMITIILMAITYIICDNFRLVRKLMTKKVLMLIGLLSLYAIYIISYKFEILKILATLFDKQPSVVAREKLMNIGIAYIQKQWLTGYGYVVDSRWIGGYNSPHNLFLDFLLAGGVIGFVLFLLIITCTIYHSKKYLRKDFGYTLLFSALVGILIASITEGYDTYNSFGIFWSICLALGNWEECRNMLDKYKYKIKISGISDRKIKIVTKI